MDSQFRTLYGDKYVPLKAEAAGLRDEVAALQKRVVAEELRVGGSGARFGGWRTEGGPVGRRFNEGSLGRWVGSG